MCSVGRSEDPVCWLVGSPQGYLGQCMRWFTFGLQAQVLSDLQVSPWYSDPSLWVGMAGVVVSAAGFLLAFSQLRRTAKATEESASVMKETLQRMARNHLLVLLPQFQVLETDLDRAVLARDPERAVALLSACNRLSRELSGVLAGDSRDFASKDISESLASLSEAASEAKTMIVGMTASKKRIDDLTADVSKKLAEVIGGVTELAVSYRSQLVGGAT